VTRSAGAQKKKSKTIKGTLNPEWNQPFLIDIGDIEGFVLSVYDWDAIGKDDFLGEVRIPLHGLRIDSTEVWYRLQARSKTKGDIAVSGEVCVMFSEPPAAATLAKIPASVVNDIKVRIKTALRTKALDVDLSSCSLAKTPNAVAENLAYVHALNLSFNHFEDWPALDKFDALKRLDLSGNRLKRVAPAIASLVSLEELLLNGNQLTALPDEIGALRQLAKLDLANNRIRALPRGIGRLQNLEEINCTGNPLTTVPPSMGECTALELCDMSCGELEALPEQFCYMTRLLELNLGNNKLASLPVSMGRMTRLCVLNVSDNQLKDLPLSLGYCIGLGKLGAGINIDRNPIENEKMLAKAKIGTDHLLAFLEQRMDAVGKPQLPNPPHSKVNDDFSVSEAGGESGGGGGISRSASTAAAASSSSSSSSSASAAPAAPQPTQLADKIVALVQWADKVIQEEFKPSLTSIKYEISQARTVEAVIQYAQLVRQLKPHIDNVRSMLPTLAAAPVPKVNANDTKLLKLTSTLDCAVADCLIVVNGLQRKLNTTQEQKDIVTFVPIVKALRETLVAASSTAPHQ
jgi:hypothetical protein